MLAEADQIISLGPLKSDGEKVSGTISARRNSRGLANVKDLSRIPNEIMLLMHITSGKYW
jgi:hypothetical protein